MENSKAEIPTEEKPIANVDSDDFEQVKNPKKEHTPKNTDKQGEDKGQKNGDADEQRSRKSEQSFSPKKEEIIKPIVGEIVIEDVQFGEKQDIKVENGEKALVEVKQNDGEKHDLQFAWTFWYVYTLSHREKKKMKRVRHYEYVLHEVFTFNTLEDFWRMYNNTYQTSEVISNTDYLIFKKHIKPEWEDPTNRAGGKWVITLPIEDDYEEEVADAWRNLLLNIIGGQFSFAQMEIINGVIYSIRDKHQRMSIWCRTNPNSSPESQKLLISIGQFFKKIVKLPTKYKFSYQLHEKALKHDLDNEAMLQV